MRFSESELGNTISAILVEGQPKIIPVKFNQIEGS